jgi:hypothetical protein
MTDNAQDDMLRHWQALRSRRRACLFLLAVTLVLTAAEIAFPNTRQALRYALAVLLPALGAALGLAIYHSGLQEVGSRQAWAAHQRLAAVQASHVRAWTERDTRGRP